VRAVSAALDNSGGPTGAELQRSVVQKVSWHEGLDWSSGGPRYRRCRGTRAWTGAAAAVRGTEGLVARGLGLEQRRSEVQKVSWHEGLDWSS